MLIHPMLRALFAALLLPHSIAAAEPPAAGQSTIPAQQAARPEYKPSMPDPSLGTGELVSRLELVDDDRIERAFRATGGSKVPLTSESFRGGWRFEASSSETPTRAWLENAGRRKGGKDGYLAERIGYCKDERTACEAWFEAGRHRSPRPNERAGKLAYQQWRNRIMEEPCIPRPAYQRTKAVLEYAAARSKLKPAYLLLEVTIDPCGEVRDATIAISSGKESLDRAALYWVVGNRYPMPERQPGSDTASPSRGVVGLIPFDFGY